MEKCRVIFTSQIQEVSKAISSDLRLRILAEIGNKQMSITQLVEALGVAQPTISINVQILKNAGLIKTLLGSGHEKMLIRTYDSLLFQLPFSEKTSYEDEIELTMPIGLFSNCKVSSPCGLAGKDGIIGFMDDPGSFYLPERIFASLIYFNEDGYLEYYFTNPVSSLKHLASLDFSAELCSEAPGFQQYYPSDVTLSINHMEIGTWTSPGDYGDRRGKNTPNWWAIGNSQYGDLTTWSIDDTGSYLNGSKCSGISLKDLAFEVDAPIIVRLEVKSDAKSRKGMNLFGSSFGDYAQDLKLKFLMQ